MKYKTYLVLFAFCSVIFLSSCETMTTKPRIPDNTVGSFNFTKKNGGGLGIEVFNVKGKKVKLTNKEIPKGSKKVDEIKLEFFNGSCTVRVCRRGRPCETVVIDDDSLCP